MILKDFQKEEEKRINDVAYKFMNVEYLGAGHTQITGVDKKAIKSFLKEHDQRLLQMIRSPLERKLAFYEHQGARWKAQDSSFHYLRGEKNALKDLLSLLDITQ
jgi:hypothetical protein